jgi:hypothetical protein
MNGKPIAEWLQQSDWNARRQNTGPPNRCFPIWSDEIASMQKSNVSNSMGSETWKWQVAQLINISYVEVEVKITSQLMVSQSLCQGFEPTLGLATRYYFLSEGCRLKVAILSLWGALSDERSGLSFVILSLVIYQYLHFPAALGPGFTQPLTEMYRKH